MKKNYKYTITPKPIKINYLQENKRLSKEKIDKIFRKIYKTNLIIRELARWLYKLDKPHENTPYGEYYVKMMLQKLNGINGWNYEQTKWQIHISIEDLELITKKCIELQKELVKEQLQ